ncbi:MAG: hypothetical protein GAK31_01475 [Stenotrophomonas maltophilia]|uniref:HDOD domain-containing protein n=1 Tax=Stenotrophomonas maltophilia TaxID=40324 RepID=A0A7V8FHU4_STEMA|nr:MAG: hypothetical protein GAK31_01475 [Stenotrophomonas maltophilia]
MRQLCQLARPRGQDMAPAMVLRLLQQWSLPVAQRVAAAWELPGPVQPVLHAHARGALADSLQFGCAAAAASLLCRHGRATQGQMLAVLEQLPGVPLHALHWSWRRLHGRSVETLAEHDAPAGAAALP